MKTCAALLVLAVVAACNPPTDLATPDAAVAIEPPPGVIYAFGTEQLKLRPNVAATTVFGTAIAIEQDTLVVGATVEGSDQGRVYVFVRTGATWTLQQKLQASDPTNGVRFGIQVGISGDTLIVGASGSNGNQQQGAAYVFTRSGTTWTEQQKLTALDGQPQDRFGQSLRVSGDTAVIGAPGDDDNGSAAGSAYVFVRTGTTWSQQQKLLAFDGTNDDMFGYGVTIEGDTVAIGARRDDDGAADAGSVYVFVRSGTTWSLQQKLTSDSGAFGNFGRDLDLSGETLLIGASQREAAAGVNRGVAYVFVRSGTTWSQQAKLTASDGANGDFFGADVALSGDTAAIGARFDDDGATNTGSIYVFKRTGTTWTQDEKVKPSDGQFDDRFSQDFDLFGTTLVGGSRGDDDLANASGAVYVFESAPPPRLDIAPAPFGFGNQRIGTTSTAQTFTITNGGGSDLVVTSISTAAPFAVQPPTLPATITPGNDLAFTGTFSPTVTGPASGTISIASNDPASPTTIAVSGTGTTPAISVAPTSHDFGPQRVGVTSAGKLITITNTGTAPLTITSTTTTGPFAVGATSVTIPPSGSQDVSVTFTPAAAGPASGSLQITHDAAGSPTTVSLSGTGIQPAIAVDPTSLDFGDQRVGTTSGPLTFDITNTGSDTLVIAAIAATAPFATTNTLPISLGVGSSTTISVTFSPSAAGAVTDDVTITSDAANGPTTTVALAGTGIEPAISVAPTLDFGDVRVGTIATQQLEVTNNGTADLTITGATTTTATFEPPAVDTFPVVIAPGNSASLALRFLPAAAGAASDTLTIASDAGPAVVDLTGNGVEPLIELDTNVLEFGLQRVGVTSPTRTVLVTNAGTSDLTISDLATSAPFAVITATPLVLAPSQVVPIEVTFTPGIEGPAAQTLAITHDATGSPTTVSLQGTGTIAELEASPAALAFGDIRIGTTSEPQPLTIRNLGLAPLAIASIAPTAGFAITGQVPVSVLPGASVTFDVTFTPTAAGTVNGALEVATSVGVTSIAATGTAVASALVVDRTSLELGPVQLGEASAAQTVMLTNSSDAPVSIGEVTVSDPQFVLDPPPSTAPIPPRGSATFAVRYVPLATGAATGQIEIVLAGETATELAIDVTGTGVGEDGGCCSTGGGGSSSSLLLGLVLAAMLRRRRRR